MHRGSQHSFTLPDLAGDLRHVQSDRLDVDAAYAYSDAESELRDTAADARDERARVREAAEGKPDPHAVQERFWAPRDRRAAAGDRITSANLRTHARADRTESAHDRVTWSIDDTTGAHRRDSGIGIGIGILMRDIDSTRRTDTPLVIAFLDVDGLESVNDARGHTAGDHVLLSLVQELRTYLRPDELVIRYCGDEFVVSWIGATTDDAERRLARANHALTARTDTSISYGVVTVCADETLLDAIERADRSLYLERTHPSRR